ELKGVGLEHALAERLITLRFLPELLDILRIARESNRDPLETAEAYYLVDADFGVGWLQQALPAATRDELWEKRLLQALTGDLQRAHRSIAGRLLQESSGREESLAECLGVFGRSRDREIQLYRALLAELRAVEQPPLAACAVAVRALVELSIR